ncbi:TonB-dependent receptor [Caulobacter henricii]|uniref:TonB-dependent receptor n=1 Tax=Caulobacter henricii TaxID=69395 RepID=A0A0P0P1V7_9CAUL|nr:TonB-dependent receptor [Caulobacter henricii]
MKSYKNDLSQVLGAVLALGLATPVLAQQAPAAATPPVTDEASTIEAITVTGTRIQGLDLKGAVQAYQIDRAVIDESGATSVIDLFSQLPAAAGGGGTFSTASSGALSSDTPVGASGVSLRGLGTSATLTLINGRRASVSAFARGQESFIDASAIPLAALERVEVLPNGASALYGADAVAGVVNYVLRKDFEGAEFTASYGDSTAASDEGRFNANLVVGKAFGDHHVTAVVDYFKRNAFYLRDREASRDSVRPSQQGFYPSFNDLFFMTNDQTEGPGNGGCAASDFKVGNLGEYCQVNSNRYVSSQDQQESLGGLITHDFAISDNVSWYNELLFQHTEARGTSSPANFSRAPIDPANPNWPAALQADIVAEGRVRRFSSYNGFPIFAWGKLIESRAVEVESDSFRYVTGLKGKFTNGWTYDAGLLFGGNDRTQSGLSGLIKSKAFYDANLGNLCSDGSTVRRWNVNLVRPSATYVGNTCEAAGKTTLWYNPFGGQTTQAAGLDKLLETTAEREGRSRTYSLDASTSGDLFTLRGRTVKAAFGAEYRRETLRDTPSGDAVATSTNPEPILGFSSTSARAERDQWAVYGELYLPLADQFDVQLAGRYDHYDAFGGDFNPKVSARFKANDLLTFRANWSTSFRAPSLAQSGAGVLLSSYRVDCRATPAACNGNAAASGQSLLSEDVGNTDLKAENADTWGGGLLFQPNSDIEIKLDYWNIEHKNLVGIAEDDFIRRALGGAFPVTGAGLLPTGKPGVEVTNGFVTDAHFQISNLGYQKTSGLDFSYTQYLPESEAGKFTLTFDATYLIDFDRKASSDAVVEKLAGDYLYPRFLANARLRWKLNDWRASLGARYVSDYKDDPDARTLAAVGLPATAQVKVDSSVTVDASLSYDFGPHSFVQLNIRNLLDETPPRVLGSSANVDLYNHDLIGRFATLRLTHRF